jgi:hypothetical protein
MSVKLCIPTLLRYDLCANLIKSAEKGKVKPEEYWVVDNGGSFLESEAYHDLHLNNLYVYRAEKNNVSKAWNYFLKNLEGDLLIANDDLEFDSDVIEKFVEAKENELDPKIIMHSAACLNAFALFLVNSSIKDSVGLFDENFDPAYYEDNDYIYRMKLLGFNERKIDGLKILHHDGGSATLKEQRRRGLNKEHDVNFSRNGQYFREKWGGMPLQEKYTHPYNDEKFSPREWKAR